MPKNRSFRATIGIRGVNPFILVSASRARAIMPGWRRPLPVRVRINGKPRDPWRINMMPVGDGSFYLYLHGEVRRVSGTSVGDRVRVEVAFDPEYRSGPQHPLPAWFRRSLAGTANGMRNWQALAPSRRKEVLRYFARLKSPEARARNLARIMPVLAGKAGRFMGRVWVEGS